MKNQPMLLRLIFYMKLSLKASWNLTLTLTLQYFDSTIKTTILRIIMSSTNIPKMMMNKTAAFILERNSLQNSTYKVDLYANLDHDLDLDLILCSLNQFKIGIISNFLETKRNTRREHNQKPRWLSAPQNTLKTEYATSYLGGQGLQFHHQVYP